MTVFGGVRSWASRHRRTLSIAAALVVAALGFTALYHLLHSVRPHAIREAFRAVSNAQIGFALLLTAASYLLLTLYDTGALRVIGRKLPWRTAALASFTSYTLSHNLGLALLTGGSVPVLANRPVWLLANLAVVPLLAVLGLGWVLRPPYDTFRWLMKSDAALQVDLTATDLRDVKGAELIQSQKMQAVGILAAGVAHEIRNPLGAISNYVYILEDQLLPKAIVAETEEKSEIRAVIGGIRRLVERSETVIRNLLDFSRDKAPNISGFLLRDVIDQILLLVGKTAQKKKVQIRVTGSEAVQVTSDSGAMQHILFNLVLNAIDAIEDGGTVEIRYSSSDSGFMVVVEDDGTGICREHMEKIFNPFFTTKGPDRGTGLGLYLVYNEVKRLGGRIAVESASGGPTRFTVRFEQAGKGERNDEKR